MRCMMVLFAALGLAATPPAMAAPAGAMPPVLFARAWIDGTDPAEPHYQVQQLDADTFVIRQSVRTNFEAPFLYLLFGRDKVLLLDTGAGGADPRPIIDELIAGWRAAHAGVDPELVVAHSHSHGDHVAGDDLFRARPRTTVVGLAPRDVAAAFAISPWPGGQGTMDLGGRRLTVLATPGHEDAHIMVYDPKLRLLLSGDALYPGRLYIPVDRMDAARASIGRLAAFVRIHPIRAVLGAHIEMRCKPGEDYPQKAPEHPCEHRLELSPAQIEALAKGVRPPFGRTLKPQVEADFIITPVLALGRPMAR